jgi:hypothetical protein
VRNATWVQDSISFAHKLLGPSASSAFDSGV